MADVITDVGLNQTANMLTGAATVAPFNYIALGTGTVAAATTDTALGAEVVRALGTVTVTGAQAVVQNTFTFAAAYAITECGLLNDATAGDLYARSDFAAINVAIGDSLQITVTLTFSQV